jgi:POT family proton-dependent oligopeptide transporter
MKLIFLWSTFGDLLKSKTQLVFTIILSALSLFGWYNLGWAFGLLFLFLTIVALMMMIYKELSSQQDKDRFVVLLLSFNGNHFLGCV